MLIITPATATPLTSDLEATGKAREPLDNNKNGIRHKKYRRRTFGTNSHAQRLPDKITCSLLIAR